MIQKIAMWTGVLFIGMFSMLSVNAQQEEITGPQLTFENNMHDYGTVFLDDMPDTKLDIKFTNTGNQPLIINNVRACCGTRVTAWPREPIAPGAEGVIKVEFRLVQRVQKIGRTVTVTYNHPQQPQIIYRITGEVVERT